MGADFDRVLRGGSWFNVARSVRCASRFANDPGLRLENRGFRPVAEVKAATESDRVLRAALRRYGYTVSRFCGDERVIGGPTPSRLEKFSQSLQRRGKSR
jgi:hypothetical protein